MYIGRVKFVMLSDANIGPVRVETRQTVTFFSSVDPTEYNVISVFHDNGVLSLPRTCWRLRRANNLLLFKLIFFFYTFSVCGRTGEHFCSFVPKLRIRFGVILSRVET